MCMCRLNVNRGQTHDAYTAREMLSLVALFVIHLGWRTVFKFPLADVHVHNLTLP